ncbi:YqgE/AlgH family protein [Rhodobacter capsulatus]|uniref:YqgE/AlgH family protein n=1 Tax=Rhodobacter capsulatus TaxID=1061 RepID=UPI00402A438F
MDLSGKLLIAMPGMGDPRFEHSVVAMCSHSAEGAMGIIVNKPLPKPPMDDLLDQLGDSGDRLRSQLGAALFWRSGRDRARLRAAFGGLVRRDDAGGRGGWR